MLLDCTLRDGGYYTNWNFDIQMVKDTIQALDAASVDVIELGYKSPVKGGKFRKCNDRFIWEVLEYRLPTTSQLAFMIDAKDFIKGEDVDYSLIDDIIHPKRESPFSICRLAIKHSEIDLSLKIGEYVKSKGYGLAVNLMGISLLSDEQINDFGAFSKLDPIALYFADSYGNLEPTRTRELVSIFKQFGYPVGVHTHDNLGLAFANCLSAMEEGAEWIDGTLLGMGRGVGNVKTEQLITYLYWRRGLYPNSKQVQRIVTHWMSSLQQIHQWGFTHNYMVSGLNHIHPLYPQELQSSIISPNRIEDILLGIEDSVSYNFSKIESHLIPKVAVVIPARYKSSRFPGKPLAKIKGKEMIIWVAEIAEKAVGRDNVYIATENEEIVDVVKGYGYKVVLTSDSCPTGTDRVAEAALEIDADIIINIQGDEPMLNPSDITKVIQEKIKHPNHVINCMAYLSAGETVEDKKIPKVITSLTDELIYISRNAIPGTKTGNGATPKKQVCIYGFNRNELKKFSDMGEKTPLEFEEDIEIIRFIEMGVKVKMVMLNSQSYAVDYPEDINIVERNL
jgi:3-deoxy-manno-octulosonate cytidylyltransferase (CMP-KDO synthetase)